MSWFNRFQQIHTGPLKAATKPLVDSHATPQATQKATSTTNPAPKSVTDQLAVQSRTQKLMAAGTAAEVAVTLGSLTGSGRTASTGTAALPNFPVISQVSASGGQKNSCGTTSLSEIMNYWNPGAPGQSTKDIDASIRKSDVGAAMSDLVGYAQSHGMRASVKSEASLDDIGSMIDQGVPVQVLIDPDGNRSDGVTHYVNVVGVTRDAANKITGLQIADSWTGQISTMPSNEFVNKWSNLREHNIDKGMSCMMVTYVPNDNRIITAPNGTKRRANDISLPSGLSRSAQAGMQIEQGGADVVNGWKSKRFGQLLSGAIDVVGGTVGLFGANLTAAGDRLKRNHGGLGYRALGSVLQAGGRLVSEGAKVVSSVLKGAVSAVSGAVSAVKSAASSIGKAVAKVFSGW